ncbi:hypothetical protein H5P28_11770 [Ruficoccus amylovorans]|uniref:Uncharacterized protein n=1 Tax=Ruficoccus amylovorans TaxID=1804625 RepID=A0A842HEC8_9BACT|nr:hypothetical protein [Ruficoccus amylovorans]MBC2594935.1 hypothetical protein [Ruficoccus amylovorans]
MSTWTLVIVGVYLGFAFFDFRGAIRAGDEVGYPASQWPLGHVVIITLLSLLWPLGMLMNVIFRLLGPVKGGEE